MGFCKGSKKVLAAADYLDTAVVRRINRATPRVYRRPFHLCIVLEYIVYSNEHHFLIREPSAPTYASRNFSRHSDIQ